MIDREALEKIARSYVGKRRGRLHREEGAAFRHGKRLAVGVIELRQLVTPDASHDDALVVAALFHDIRMGDEPHGEKSAAAAVELLRGRVDKSVLREALTLIRLHDTAEERDEFLSIFRDADALDQLGCCEIWTSFVEGFDTGHGIEDAADGWYGKRFDAYLAGIRRKLHFDASRRVFDEKAAFEMAFRERLARESHGHYILTDRKEQKT